MAWIEVGWAMVVGVAPIASKAGLVGAATTGAAVALTEPDDGVAAGAVAVGAASTAAGAPVAGWALGGEVAGAVAVTGGAPTVGCPGAAVAATGAGAVTDCA